MTYVVPPYIEGHHERDLMVKTWSLFPHMIKLDISKSENIKFSALDTFLELTSSCMLKIKRQLAAGRWFSPGTIVSSFNKT